MTTRSHTREIAPMRPTRRRIRPSRFSPLALGMACAALAALTHARAIAGDLTVAWGAAGPAASTHYRVFVGDRPGVYDRVVEAGTALRLTVTDLEDGKVHYLAVKALDDAGHEAPDFSPELACLARPRVDSVRSPALSTGGSAWVALRGANFDRDVQVRSSDPGLRVRASVLEPDGSLSVLVEAAPTAAAGVASPSVSSFTLFNPCRRADAFFQAHPQAADVDGSGSVDEDDARAVSAAIGSRRGESGYAGAADVDADGIVDGRDLDRVISLLRPASRPASAAPAAPAAAPAAPVAHAAPAPASDLASIR